MRNPRCRMGRRHLGPADELLCKKRGAGAQARNRAQDSAYDQVDLWDAELSRVARCDNFADVAGEQRGSTQWRFGAPWARTTPRAHPLPQLEYPAKCSRDSAWNIAATRSFRRRRPHTMCSSGNRRHLQSRCGEGAQPLAAKR